METKCYALIVDTSWSFVKDKGWGNGYVAVPKEHPLYGVDYNDVDSDKITIHGGLTYSKNHIPEDVEAFTELLDNIPDTLTKFWVLGFDTMHYMDNQQNCNKGYVIQQTLLLKQQLEQYQ